MARVRIVEPTARLDSWEDVNLTLADIGEHQRAIETLETDMQAGIDNLKLEADQKAEPHKKAIAELELQIKTYVDEHRDEMEGKKTKVLTFGSTGYRKSSKVTLPKGAAKIKDIILRLRAKGMTDCILNPPPKIDKDALKKYPPNDIVEVGANLKVDDVFWYEVDRDRLIQQ